MLEIEETFKKKTKISMESLINITDPVKKSELKIEDKGKTLGHFIKGQ